MPVHELAALGAAILWALTGVISVRPVAVLGAVGFNLIRQTLVAIMLALAVWIGGRWQSVDMDLLMPLVWSGLIGIFLGDTLLFLALRRLGPRRVGALFAMNAPMAAVLGRVFLGEQLSTAAVGGIVLSSAGVALCVLGRGGRHRLDAVDGAVGTGVALGLLAALAQATGSLIARPVMQAGMDPVAGSMVRVLVAVVCLGALASLRLPMFRLRGRATPALVAQIGLSGFVAMGMGMTLLLFALQGGEVGIVSTLSALSPVMILPVLWIVTGDRPSPASWLGATIAVGGMALIFLS